MKPNIELHIEELVLHGFKPGDRHRIGEAVERELTRLLVEQGLPLVKGTEIARLDCGSFSLAKNSRAERTGSQVAKAVYGQMLNAFGRRSDQP
jgi:hypothetical protein